LKRPAAANRFGLSELQRKRFLLQERLSASNTTMATGQLSPTADMIAASAVPKDTSND